MDQHTAHEQSLGKITGQQNNSLPGSKVALPLPFELPMDAAEELSGKIKILEEIGLSGAVWQ